MRVFYGLIITAVILMIGACALKAYKKEGALARVVFLYELVRKHFPRIDARADTQLFHLRPNLIS